MAASASSKRVVVAIDFGTTCTGYAYYVNDGKLDLMGTINTEMAWTAAGKFGLQAPTTDIDRNIQLKDDKGKELNAMDIFECAIEYIRKDLQKQLKSNSVEIKLGDISWVITVPAIWRESAKAFMREAAEKAGVATEKLTLALEPECAAIFCKELATAHAAISLEVFNPGSRYIIVDLGGFGTFGFHRKRRYVLNNVSCIALSSTDMEGQCLYYEHYKSLLSAENYLQCGTVDTTVHEVKSDGTLKELHAATGGAWGGQLVDKAFMEFVQEMVTPSVWDDFIRFHIKAWISFCNAFDQCKRKFTMETEQCMVENVPPILKEIFKKVTGKDLARDIQRRYGHDKVKLYNDSGTLELPREYMMGFFNQALDPICEHITGICTQPQLKLQYLILVGGFAESPIVKERIKKALDGKVRIIVPRDRGTAVLKGAVMYGINPNIINSRISPFSYGISTRKRFVPELHAQNKKIKGLFGNDVVLDAFDIHILKGQDVLVGVDNKGKRYKLLKTAQPEIDLQVYQSDNKKPLFCDEKGSKRIGKLSLKIPKQLQNTELSLTVWMTCYGTELVAHATAKDRKGQNCVKCTCKLDFLGRDVVRSSDFLESND